jgi:hypothetical protein
MKCRNCGGELYSAGEICPSCEKLSDSRKLLPPEQRAFREAGHAVMSYLIRKGFTEKYVPVDRSLILPAFEQVAIEGDSAPWAKITFGLGSFVTVAQVLLAGYAAEKIKLAIHEEPDPDRSVLVFIARGLLGGYLSEYNDDTPYPEHYKRSLEWLKEILGYVEDRLQLYWESVEALAEALLHFKVLSEAQAFQIIEQKIPESAKIRASIFTSRTIEENLSEVIKNRTGH